jgi:glycosyltransferase involved in cell wall biosynthesis
MGSVSQIGWEWYSRLARRVPVTLVTHVRNREALECAGAPIPGSEIVYIDTEWFAGPLYRLASRIFRNSQHSVFLISSLDFYVYDRDAVRKLAGRPRPDLTHAVTPVSPMAATRLAALGAPLVLGPWNGGLQTPAGFPEFTSADSTWLYPARELGRLVEAFVRATRRAALILSASEATDRALSAAARRRTRRMLENGVDLDVFRPSPWPVPPSDANPLRILFTGRLIPVKAVPLILRAMRNIGDAFPIRLRIAGDGPCAAAWKEEAARLGLAKSVDFLGNLALEGVAAELEQAHVFCLPSVRESGGAVLLEAMACARPVIAIAHGGPAEIVDDEVGLAIPPTGADFAVKLLAETFRDIVARPDAWRARGEAGRRRAEARYSWDAKIDGALDLYRQLLQGTLKS